MPGRKLAATLLALTCLAAIPRVSQAQSVGRFDGTYYGTSQAVEQRRCPSTDLTRTIANNVMDWQIYSAARQVTTVGIVIKPDGTFSQRIGHGSIKGKIVDGRLTATRVSGTCTFRISLTKR